MLRLKLRNVRCFTDPPAVRIAPLTVLVGENSTGKSSFLALQRVALQLIDGTLEVNFNTDPFFLGAYDQIAHYRGGRGGRAQFFEIGVENLVKSQAKSAGRHEMIEASYTARFVKRGSQPRLSKLSFKCGDYSLQISYDSDQTYAVEITSPSWSGSLPKEALQLIPFGSSRLGFNFRFFHYSLSTLVRMRDFSKSDDYKEINISKLDAEILSGYFTEAIKPLSLSSFASAPVRTKPERTYNPVDDAPKSEGSHVPMLLAKTRFSDKKKWEKVKRRLELFGKTSGLFEEISLKTLGHSDSDPFQIMIKIFGPRSNLLDVGYGVSQVLPIVTDIIMRDEPRFYLLQQPEVHLHPRAQAELASFFASATKKSEARIMVETHSDYLIDRVRMEVRDRKLKPDDVSILFFERDGRSVSIHQLGLDEQGNLLNVPKTYRSFFTAEESRFFGLD